MMNNVTTTGKSNCLLFMVSMSVSTGTVADTIDTTGQEPYERCGYCHEYDGNSRFPLYPNLAGQTSAYIEKQLRDFRSGRRSGDMQATAELLSDHEINIVATYFSQQRLQSTVVPTLSETERRNAEQLFSKGDMARGIPACISCHGQSGEGMAAAPRLAGQHATYLGTQLRAFKTGTRRNDTGEQMRVISRRLSDQEIEIITQYLHGLPAMAGSEFQIITENTDGYEHRREQ